MNRLAVLRVLNFLLVISFLIQALTITAIFSRTGPRGIIKVHIWNGAFFITMIIFHLILNWSWVKANWLKKKEIPVNK
jgi:hypothetical protein